VTRTERERNKSTVLANLLGSKISITKKKKNQAGEEHESQGRERAGNGKENIRDQEMIKEPKGKEGNENKKTEEKIKA